MNTIGIGKIVVDNTKPGWNYPHFHVILFKENGDNSFYAYCMELGIDAFSEDSAKTAFSEIAANILDAINQYDNKDSLFGCLLDIAQSDHNDVFWKEYRIAETELAQCAGDLGSGLIDDLKKEIEQLRRSLNQNHDDPWIMNMSFSTLKNNQAA